MKRRNVRFTKTAQAHVGREMQWWRENRDYKDVFAEEFEQALRVLALLPGVGAPYTRSGMPALRRVYLGKVACHIYYTFDDEEVIVRAVWGARRGRDLFGWR